MPYGKVAQGERVSPEVVVCRDKIIKRHEFYV